MRQGTRLIAVATLAGMLGACTQNTRPMNFSVGEVNAAQRRQDAELKTISMTTAPPGEAAGKIAPIADLAIPAWKVALEDAIDRSAIFRDDATRKLTLNVKVTQLDTPSVGLDMRTTTTARYELIDRATRATLFISDVSTTGLVPAGYAFAGAERAWESMNRAVRDNIQQFLQQISGADLSKPVFPGTPPAGTAPGTPAPTS